MARGSGLAHAFVAPSLDGAPTGGTLYNARLIAALRRAGLDCRHLELAALPAVLSDGADVLWIDSLHLAAMPGLRRRAGSARLHLVLHYLPSLVRQARALALDSIDDAERRAIELADAVLVTSPFMRGVLDRTEATRCPVLCVEPGAELAPATPGASASADLEPLRAVMLCSLVEAKGVLPLLAALAASVRSADRFRLSIAGALDREPAYAAACGALAAGPALRDRVRLLGPLSPAHAGELLRTSDVLLSASRIESYGMALAEARAAGVPLIARTGGHSAAHVDPAAGGVLAADEREVAACLLELTRTPGLRMERQRRARARVHARTWDQAAAELIGQLAARGLS